VEDLTAAARRNPMQAVAMGAGIAYPLLRHAPATPMPVPGWREAFLPAPRPANRRFKGPPMWHRTSPTSWVGEATTFLTNSARPSRLHGMPRPMRLAGPEK
jgi:hypothetical protein